MKELTIYDSQSRPIEVTWIDDEGNPTINLLDKKCYSLKTRIMSHELHFILESSFLFLYF